MECVVEVVSKATDTTFERHQGMLFPFVTIFLDAEVMNRRFLTLLYLWLEKVAIYYCIFSLQI